MKRAQFAAAVLCALVMAGLAINAVHDGRWLWMGVWLLAFVACVVIAFCAAVRAIRVGKA